MFETKLLSHSSRHSLSASVGPVVEVVFTFSIPLRASHIPLGGLTVTNDVELLELIKAERVTKEMRMCLIVEGIFDFLVCLSFKVGVVVKRI